MFSCAPLFSLLHSVHLPFGRKARVFVDSSCADWQMSWWGENSALIVPC